MKVYSLLAALALALFVTSAQAQMGPDDQFVGIYGMIQQADALADAGQPKQALLEYTAAQTEVAKFAEIYPEWNPNIIAFRKRYLADKIASTTALIPAAPAAVVTTPGMSTMAAPMTNAAAGADDPLNDLRRQVQNLQNDNADLAAKLKEALTTQPAAVDPQQLAAAQEKILALMKQNDLLQASLANQTTAMGKSSANKTSRSEGGNEVDALLAQVKTLQARVNADEAPPVPYSAEELALFQPVVPGVATPAPTAAAAAPAAPVNVENQPPAGSDDIVASAKAHFADHDYDSAAGDYRKLLQMDQKNAYALARLAAIDLQMGHLTDADRHIEASYAQNVNDAYTLSVLGNLKFQQGKYDEALDILARAAVLDPQNPSIQSLLGVSYGHKGLHLQAETAFRKAVTLDPNFGAAHYNLAVAYMGEQPPRAALARYHYQKALATGQPRNPDFEKLLADNGAPVSAQ